MEKFISLLKNEEEFLWQRNLAESNGKSIVGLVINMPPGEQSVQGVGAKIDRIIESEELAPEIQAAFATLEKTLIGVSYKPVMYIGKQIVRGENHYFFGYAFTW